MKRRTYGSAPLPTLPRVTDSLLEVARPSAADPLVAGEQPCGAALVDSRGTDAATVLPHPAARPGGDSVPLRGGRKAPVREGLTETFPRGTSAQKPRSGEFRRFCARRFWVSAASGPPCKSLWPFPSSPKSV